MTYCLEALVSTVILAPILGGLQWKIFALDFFQRCGTTLYIIEWTVSYAKQRNNMLLLVVTSHQYYSGSTYGKYSRYSLLIAL